MWPFTAKRASEGAADSTGKTSQVVVAKLGINAASLRTARRSTARDGPFQRGHLRADLVVGLWDHHFRRGYAPGMMDFADSFDRWSGHGNTEFRENVTQSAFAAGSRIRLVIAKTNQIAHVRRGKMRARSARIFSCAMTSSAQFTNSPATATSFASIARSPRDRRAARVRSKGGTEWALEPFSTSAKSEVAERVAAGGRRQAAGGRRQAAGGRRQRVTQRADGVQQRTPDSLSEHVRKNGCGRRAQITQRPHVVLYFQSATLRALKPLLY